VAFCLEAVLSGAVPTGSVRRCLAFLPLQSPSVPRETRRVEDRRPLALHGVCWMSTSRLPTNWYPAKVARRRRDAVSLIGLPSRRLRGPKCVLFVLHSGGETSLLHCVHTKYIRWSDVTESMVTIRSSCCGYNLAWCVELKGEDLSSYSHKIESLIYENVIMITSVEMPFL